ncbi:hypothetical protein [Streptomyces collinus]
MPTPMRSAAATGTATSTTPSASPPAFAGIRPTSMRTCVGSSAAKNVRSGSPDRSVGGRREPGSAYGPERTRVRTVRGSPSKVLAAPSRTVASAVGRCSAGTSAFTISAASAPVPESASACRRAASPTAPE